MAGYLEKFMHLIYIYYFTAISRRAKMMTTIKTACLPKLICELTSSVHQDQLSEMERSLLNLIR